MSEQKIAASTPLQTPVQQLAQLSLQCCTRTCSISSASTCTTSHATFCISTGKVSFIYFSAFVWCPKWNSHEQEMTSACVPGMYPGFFSFVGHGELWWSCWIGGLLKTSGWQAVFRDPPHLSKPASGSAAVISSGGRSGGFIRWDLGYHSECGKWAEVTVYWRLSMGIGEILIS